MSGPCLPEASREFAELEELLRGGRRAADAPALPVEVQRRRYLRLAEMFSPPADAAVRSDTITGVPVEWYGTPELVASIGPEQAVVVFVHGGGYCIGGVDTHRNIAARLALAARLPVVSVEYPLAPESPYPAAVDTCAEVLHALGGGAKGPSRRLALAGDSAGGALALSVAVRIRDQGGRLPVCLGLMCPWVDLALTGPSTSELVDFDPLTTVSPLRQMVSWYAEGRDPADSAVSPLYANLDGLPPVHLQFAGRDLIRDDSRRLAAALRAAGVVVKAEEWPAMVHVWHLFAGRVPEGDQALAALGTALGEELTRRR